MTATLAYFVLLSIVCAVLFLVFAYKYVKKSEELDAILKETELDEREACILRRAKADAQILVNTALAHHCDACHDKDEHFM